MKRFLYTLFAVLAFFACSDSGTDNGGGQEKPKQPEITLNATNVDFTTEGGTDEITFTSSTAWTAEVVNSRADAWCSINPTSGEAGNAKITVTTTANDTPDDRTASIIIKAGSASKTINISQKQKDALTVTASKFEVGAEGGEVTIEVKANIDFEYAIEESAKEWITYQTTRAVKTSTLVFKVAENESEEKRECKIVIKSGEFNETVTIYQAGSTPTIILTKDKFSVPSAANTITVEVKSNVDVAVEMPDNAEWIKESTTRAFSTNTYNFDIEQNESYDNRTAEIKFTNKENDLYEVVTITQMQRDAIVVADDEYEIGHNGGTLNFEIQTNVNITVYTSHTWIQLTSSRGLEPKSLHFNIASCPNDSGREGKITISGGDATQTIKIKQDGILSSERKALIAFYNATGGDNWTNNENWCSDKPVGEWYGIDVNEKGSVVGISLSRNNLVGHIPSDVGMLTSLERIFLYENKLSGNIPPEICRWENIEIINVYGNQLTGSIPEGIGNLKNLNTLWLQWNSLGGKIPAELMKLPCWDRSWYQILDQQAPGGFSREGVVIKAPSFSIRTLDGKLLTNDIFTQNKYTIIYHFFDWCPYSTAFTPELVHLYNLYKDSGLGIFSPTSQSRELVLAYAKKFNISWPLTIECKFGGDHDFGSFIGVSPSLSVVDPNGIIVFNPIFDDYCDIAKFLANNLGLPNGLDPNYVSSDYSKDGEVKLLQKATVGNGINIVLMGDGYTDRLIADGTYDNTMNTAMEKLFTEEPYKSFRNYFNVYSVSVVSANEVFGIKSHTSLGSYFGEGTHVGGNDSKAFEYALKAISEEQMDNAMVVVIMNDIRHAGTCWMYWPEDGDWGNGVSVSYFPAGPSDESLERLIHHETCGHGFAKLADEYAYQENGQIPDEEIESNKSTEKYGWWKNADFTNDPAKVKWTHFLNDSRYSNEGLGVYEGAFTYWTGAYRPTQNSIMNTNVGGFNAPSREAIYYRIHKLAYGANWEYDYEKFVEWDAMNRASSATRGVPYRLDIPDDYKPTHPPVVINKSWRDAK